MILPILAYGHPVLRSKCIDIDSSYKDLDKLIKDMWDTMYSSDGVGLAAPQIGKSLRLFIVPVEKLSKQITFSPLFNNSERICEPKNPAPPATKLSILIIFFYELIK